MSRSRSPSWSLSRSPSRSPSRSRSGSDLKSRPFHRHGSPHLDHHVDSPSSPSGADLHQVNQEDVQPSLSSWWGRLARQSSTLLFLESPDRKTALEERETFVLSFLQQGFMSLHESLSLNDCLKTQYDDSVSSCSPATLSFQPWVDLSLLFSADWLYPRSLWYLIYDYWEGIPRHEWMTCSLVATLPSAQQWPSVVWDLIWSFAADSNRPLITNSTHLVSLLSGWNDESFSSSHPSIDHKHPVDSFCRWTRSRLPFVRSHVRKFDTDTAFSEWLEEWFAGRERISSDAYEKYRQCFGDTIVIRAQVQQAQEHALIDWLPPPFYRTPAWQRICRHARYGNVSLVSLFPADLGYFSKCWRSSDRDAIDLVVLTRSAVAYLVEQVNLGQSRLVGRWLDMYAPGDTQETLNAWRDFLRNGSSRSCLILDRYRDNPSWHRWTLSE